MITHGASHLTWVLGKWICVDLVLLATAAIVLGLAFWVDEEEEDWAILAFILGGIAFFMLPILLIAFIIAY